MASYFNEQDVDEFRDCFYLNTYSNGMIKSFNELKLIMRSLGMSPTISELNMYFKEKGGKLSFADFLDVMHIHSEKEKISKELNESFRAFDSNQSGKIHVRDLKHILCQWGEKLDNREVDQILREANIHGSYIKYQDFIKILSAPAPDY